MIQLPDHPSRLLKPSWINLLRNEADQATHSGQLTPKQLKLFYDQRWFKALAPKKYGGLQWSLGEVVRFEEAIGWVEGSAGWVFTLCSGAGWFGGFIEPGFAAKIFKPKTACLAGSGTVGGVGKADKTGSLTVSGHWVYATGAPHATLFTANVYMESEHKVRALLFLPQEVSVEKTWNPIGLIASASESFSVYAKTVATERIFDIDANKPVIQESLYRMPFGPLAEATIAANLSGMALHFMEEVAVLWSGKKEMARLQKDRGAQVPDWMAVADARLQAYCDKWLKMRAKIWAAVADLEQFVNGNMSIERITQDATYQRKSEAVSKAAQNQAALCRELVNTLYPYTGLTGASADSAIGKIWRDFQTGSQHALFVPKIKP